MDFKKIINVAVIAHVDAGKSTLVDAFLAQSHVFSDHEEIEAILQEHFPDLYDLHEQGRIEVDEIYVYTTRGGEPKYKVSLRYMPPHVH